MSATPGAAPTGGGRLTALLSGVTRTLLVLGIGLAGAAFVLPDDGGDAYEALAPSTPVRLVVPSLKVRADVRPVAVAADRVLDPPQDVQQVGWWDASAQPGEAAGQTVLTGHSVHTGGGVLDDLRQVRRGARIDLRTDEGRMRYRVTRVRVMDKEQVAQRSGRLFGQSRGDGRLVLVSCTDWDGAVYESNVVVLAEALGQPVRPDRAGRREARARSAR